MKKVIAIVLSTVMLLGLSACGSSKKANTDNKKVEASDTTKTNDASDSASNSDASKQSDGQDSVSSQVKKALGDLGFKVSKLQTVNKNNVAIYATFPYEVSKDKKSFYEQAINSAAAANKYEGFELIDTDKDETLTVYCDKDNSKVRSIVFNKDQALFESNTSSTQASSGTNSSTSSSSSSSSNSSSSTSSSSNVNSTSNSNNQDIVAYVENNVPEVNELKNSLQKSGSKMVIYVESQPKADSSDKYLRDYYGVYVGESKTSYDVNLMRFAVNKNTKEILYYDVENDKYMTLQEWRASKKK